MNKEKIMEIARISKAEKWPYPKIFQALKEEGVTSYEVTTTSHQICYFVGEAQYKEPVPSGFQPLALAKKFDVSLIKEALEGVRSKKTDYEEFLRQIVRAGVASYRVDMASRTVTYFGEKTGDEYKELVPKMKEAISLKDCAHHCEKAWSFYAVKHQIRRTDEFYFLKMQEELGELTRTFMELNGNEHAQENLGELRKKFAGDCASLIGNALILALHFGVDIERTILEKFPVPVL